MNERDLDRAIEKLEKACKDTPKDIRQDAMTDQQLAEYRDMSPEEKEVVHAHWRSQGLVVEDVIEWIETRYDD